MGGNNDLAGVGIKIINIVDNFRNNEKHQKFLLFMIIRNR